MSALDDINLADFDFIDFGSSKGGSIIFAKNELGGKKGLGIDIDPNKIAEARGLGYDCVEADATNLEMPDNSFDFSIMSHFLEHVPTEEIAERAIHSAIRVSKKYVFIKGPWFDADEYLESLGLKFYWSDWHGHPNHIGEPQLERIIKKAGDLEYKIWGDFPIRHSKEKFFHPLGAPRDKHAYLEEYGVKPLVEFTIPMYREVLCVIKISEWPEEYLTRRLPHITLISENIHSPA